MSSPSDMGDAATKHGRELSQHGFTVDQVVHDYGDLCQSITEMAVESDTPFETIEFKTLNRCLDNVIADAVTEFMYQRDFVAAGKEPDAVKLRLAAFPPELRTLPPSPMPALTATQEDDSVLGGATARCWTRTLLRMWNDLQLSISS